jgi:hypothetical protein
MKTISAGSFSAAGTSINRAGDPWNGFDKADLELSLARLDRMGRQAGHSRVPAPNEKRTRTARARDIGISNHPNEGQLHLESFI